MRVQLMRYVVGSMMASAGLSATARAQPFAIDWYTIDGGANTTPMTGGTFAVVGTIGQPDAGALAGGAFGCLGGFWSVAAGSCYANCDGSTTAPVLNVLDFACFLNKFSSGDPYANCDASTAAPALNVLDFACFLNRFAAGCL